MFRYGLPLLIVAVMISILAYGLTQNPGEVPSPLIGKPAPGFVLPVLGDEVRHFSQSDLKGHVSLVNVWASWCVACLQEHPVLMDYASSSSIPVYGLNYKDSSGHALAWLKRHGNPFTLSLYDPQGDVGLDWGVYGVPETFVLDSEAIIRYKHIGPVTEQNMKQIILPLIEKLQRKAS